MLKNLQYLENQVVATDNIGKNKTYLSIIL